MARTRKRAVWLAAESTYGADPSTNGSGYKAVPAFSVGDLGDGLEQLETNYATGRNFPTAPIAGRDGWSIDLELPWTGLASAAGDGVTPGADDWADLILSHIHGTQALVDGEGFAGSSTTSSWILDTDAYNIQALIAAYESGVPTAAPRTQWGLITVDGGSGTYTVAPTADAAPTTSAVAFGHKDYTLDDDGGATLALVVQDDDLYYLCLGGRVTASSCTSEVGKKNIWKVTISGDSKVITDTSTKSALPSILSAPAVTPTKGLLSPVWFNGTKYATRVVTLDWGIKAAEIESTSATNGRADYQSIEVVPTLTIEPLRTDAILNLKRGVTSGRLLVQYGAGVLANSILNTLCVHFEEAYVAEVTRTDNNGVARQTVKFMLSDKVYFSGSTASRAFQVARA
jgi:hypothetical protein